MRMPRPFFLALVLVLAGLTAAHANLTLHSGQETFNVRVTNSHFKPIYDARGSVWISGTSARIEVEAPGYRRGYTTVYLSGNTHYHSCDVRLDDPSVNGNVRTTKGQFVQGGYVSPGYQGLYWADEYGIRAQFPKKGFEKLTERLIEVRVNSLYAFAPRLYLSDAGSQWNLEVVIKRRDLRDLFNTIDVIVTPDPVETPAPAPAPTPVPEAHEPIVLADDYRLNQQALQNTDLEEIRDVLTRRLESLARRLRAVAPALDEGEAARLLQAVGAESPVGREIRAIRTFGAIQR